MEEPTLLSTNPLQNVEEEPLKENLPSAKNEATWLSEIPLLGTTPLQKTQLKEEPSFSEPSLCEEQPNEETVEGKYEYEFSLCFNGCLCFVHLFDTSDVSACERVLHRPVQTDEIVYSPTSGNGFITDETFKYTFTKEPYKRAWTTHADIKAGVEYENTVARTKPKHKLTADDILSSF